MEKKKHANANADLFRKKETQQSIRMEVRQPGATRPVE